MNTPPQPLPPVTEGRAFIALLKSFSPFHFNLRRIEPQVSEEVHRSMQDAVVEGAFSGIMAVFIGGVILTGFALSLGANDFIIGIIAAIQSGAHLFQMRAFRMIERRGKRKEIAVRFAALSRLLWIPICAIVFITVEPLASYRIWMFLALFTVTSVVGLTSYVAWVSWLVDLVPERVRGRFFAHRNLAMGAVGVLLGVAAGKFLDLWKDYSLGPEPYAFVILIGFGLLFGLRAVTIQNRMYHPHYSKPAEQSSFWESLRTPFSDPAFRKVFIFRIFYDSSFWMAGSFYSLYMLTQEGLSFTFVSAMMMLATLTNLLSLRAWGKLIDRYGNKPVLYLCLIGKLLFAILWLFTTPTTIALYIIIHAFGVFDAGNSLAIPNLIYKIAPAERRVNYITVDGTMVGIAATIAPLIGGAIAIGSSTWSVTLGPLVWEHFHFLFLVVILLRIATFFFLKRVEEPQATPLTRVIGILNPMRSVDVFAGMNQALSILVSPARFVVKRVVRNMRRAKKHRKVKE